MASWAWQQSSRQKLGRSSAIDLLGHSSSSPRPSHSSDPPRRLAALRSTRRPAGADTLISSRCRFARGSRLAPHPVVGMDGVGSWNPEGSRLRLPRQHLRRVRAWLSAPHRTPEAGLSGDPSGGLDPDVGRSGEMNGLDCVFALWPSVAMTRVPSNAAVEAKASGGMPQIVDGSTCLLPSLSIDSVFCESAAPSCLCLAQGQQLLHRSPVSIGSTDLVWCSFYFANRGDGKVPQVVSGATLKTTAGD